MSHDLDISTGKPAMAYVGDAPWHGLGEKLPDNQSIEVWLKAARLEWHLDRLPVQYLVDGRVRTMADRFVLARSDTREALSIVSSDYEIVQPKEVLEFYRDLVKDFGYTLETAGALNGGRKVWALARTGITGHVEDEVDPMAAYVLLATSCDKTLATTAAFTSVRVVCQNTLFFALDDIKSQHRKVVKVPHTRRFETADVKRQLGLINESWTAFMDRVRKAAAHPMNDQSASEFFNRVLGQKPAKPPQPPKPLSPKAERDRIAMMSLFRSAPGQELATARGTLWGALNAVTYYVDHVRAGGVTERLDSAWFGTGNNLKDSAWAEAEALIDKDKTPA